jgi:hypothetical protein
MYTPSSLKEESDLSSGPPSSDSGYEPTPNYVTVSSSSSSPKRPYFNSMYDNREEPDFTTPLDCHYDGSLNSSLSLNGFRSTSNNNIHPLTHHQHSHPQPHSPLFYHQSYSGYPFYSTSYYSNGLGITPCQDNDNASKASSAAAVAIHAASSTTASAAASCAVAAAAAAALLPSPTGNSDVLTHNQDSQYSRSSSIPSSSAESNAFVSYPPIMPENTFVTEL